MYDSIILSTKNKVFHFLFSTLFTVRCSLLFKLDFCKWCQRTPVEENGNQAQVAHWKLHV